MIYSKCRFSLVFTVALMCHFLVTSFSWIHFLFLLSWWPHAFLCSPYLIRRGRSAFSTSSVQTKALKLVPLIKRKNKSGFKVRFESSWWFILLCLSQKKIETASQMFVFLWFQTVLFKCSYLNYLKWSKSMPAHEFLYKIKYDLTC